MPVEIDVAGNIKAIEKIKCDLLGGVSELFTNMQSGEFQRPDDKADKRLTNLSDIVISAYRLAEKLGASYSELDSKAVKKLKLSALNDNKYTDASALIRHFRRNEPPYAASRAMNTEEAGN